jgi:hypothetical protein
MVRREHVVELGGWDDVRMGADTEFYARLLARHQQEKSWIVSAVPLTAQLVRADSLTGDAFTGISTVRYGARREYLESFRYWHGLETARDMPCFKLPAGGRAFPAPAICKPGPKAEQHYDILWISDLAQGALMSATVAMLSAAKQRGLRSACLHWPHLESAARMTHARMRQSIHQGLVNSVVAGEAVRCRLILVTDASVLQAIPDILPKIRADRAIVVVDQAVKADEVTHLHGFDRVLRNAEHVFGIKPVFAPASPVIRSSLLAAVPNQSLTDEDWLPLVDQNECHDVTGLGEGFRHQSRLLCTILTELSTKVVEHKLR